MNDNSSHSTSAQTVGITAEAISRRAYELWEQEGRPESRDLQHWLRAEQELRSEAEAGTSQAKPGGQSAPAASTPAQPAPRPSAAVPNVDTQPLKGTRAAAAASRDAKPAATPKPSPDKQSARPMPTGRR